MVFSFLKEKLSELYWFFVVCHQGALNGFLFCGAGALDFENRPLYCDKITCLLLWE